jgi:hypothetical protein
LESGGSDWEFTKNVLPVKFWPMVTAGTGAAFARRLRQDKVNRTTSEIRPEIINGGNLLDR